MGTAVERLEIWTAAMLLLVAMIVGAAGTLEWVNDTPERTGRMVDESSASAVEAFARSASTVWQQPTQLVYRARNAGSLAFETLERLPGGVIGVVAAALAGSLALPLLIAAARGVRLAAGTTEQIPAMLRPRARLRCAASAGATSSTGCREASTGANRDTRHDSHGRPCQTAGYTA